MALIVVADNDPDALELALTDLRLEGHEVRGALDAEAARRLVSELQPDALVLDYRMPPGPSGLELAEDLVCSEDGAARMRIVIYSNYQSPTLTSRAQRIGVPFLAKGNLRTLRAAVAS